MRRLVNWLHWLLCIVESLPERILDICWGSYLIIKELDPSDLVFLLKSAEKEVLLFALCLYESFVFDAINLFLKNFDLVLEISNIAFRH